MREEKKYEVLPGVEIPDMKKIQEAASDFSVSEVGDIEIRTINMQPVLQASEAGATAADLSQLQQLGSKFAEEDAKSRAESREKMDKIMHNVKAPESIRDLKESHIAQLNSDKRKELEESIKAEDQQMAEEAAKNKAREERRQLQQRLLEESRERAEKLKAEKERLDKVLAAKERADKERAEREAKEKAEKEAAESASGTADSKPAAEEPAKKTDEKPAEKPAEKTAASAEKTSVEEKPKTPAPKPVEPEVKKTATMVSNAEAFDDFKEFLEDDK